jgi:KipI family sensor histidine kinase inhibitor
MSGGRPAAAGAAVAPKLTTFGDSAVLVSVDDVATAHAVAAVVERARSLGTAPVGVEESVVGFHNVVVHLDPLSTEPRLVEPWLADLISLGHPARSEAADDLAAAAHRIQIPVTFDGPDLEAVAALCGCSPEGVAGLLCGTDLRVGFVGFAPGFPYLVGLPPALAAIPRRDSPRPSVDAGSVAVAGGFASVYPRSTPGGWMLLGQTTTRLFDPSRPPYALLRSGDTVRFSILEDSDAGLPGGSGRAPRALETSSARTPLPARGDRFIAVLEPGLLSLVEDGGRHGLAGLGIPRAGPADPETMRLANRLVGNPDGEAAIEVTAIGPRLRFAGDAHIAVVASGPDGVDIRIDDRPVATDVVVPVHNDQELTVGRVRQGLRAYLAVSGGIDVPLVVGSRSSDLLSGLGHGPLVAGDRLDLGTPVRPRGQLAPPLEPAVGQGPTVIRVLTGPHLRGPAAASPLAARNWTVGEASNRIGLRLDQVDHPTRSEHPEGTDHPSGSSGSGGSDASGTSRTVPSTGMVTGAIQLPPDGNPIILMPDHATVGGYPVIACVIAADLPLLGQLRPGETVSFAFVDPPHARRLLLDRERTSAARVTGWFPTEAAT